MAKKMSASPPRTDNSEWLSVITDTHRVRNVDLKVSIDNVIFVYARAPPRKRTDNKYIVPSFSGQWPYFQYISDK